MDEENGGTSLKDIEGRLAAWSDSLMTSIGRSLESTSTRCHRVCQTFLCRVGTVKAYIPPERRVKLPSFLRPVPTQPSINKHFDAYFYNRSYSDVSARTGRAFDHYMTRGWREGRNPSPAFNTLFYRDSYLKGVQENPLEHYADKGLRLGLKIAASSDSESIDVQMLVCMPYFSEMEYRAFAAYRGDDPLRDYLSGGWREAFPRGSSLDFSDYLEKHRYVFSLNVSPLYHFSSQVRFNTKGSKPDSRSLSSKQIHSSGVFLDDTARHREHVIDIIGKDFDTEYYLDRNADVKKAGVSALKHYIDYGYKEGRNPSSLFNTNYYMSQLPNFRNFGINPLHHYLLVGKQLGIKPNPVGLKNYPKLNTIDLGRINDLTPAVDVERASAIVAMPVFKGKSETITAIFAVLQNKQKTPFVLHVVNDCSPDIELTEEIEGMASFGLFKYEKNPTNKGFVATANSIMRQYPDLPVILLNTDAVVSGDWIDRMLAHAARDNKIATITPFSNNATIFSYPTINENNDIEPECSVSELDSVAARANQGRLSDVPTGVGFCFYISSAARAAVGLFDEDAFGRGYGEENDFCLRAAKAGFRNTLAENIFVYHVGKVSFGIPKEGDMEPGQRALIKKHPEYPEAVRQHLASNETEIGRVRFDLARLAAATKPRSVVIVTHALSGGIANHVEKQIDELSKDGRGAILVRVGVQNRWSIEISAGTKHSPFTPNLSPIAFARISPHLKDFLAWLKPEAVHVHSFVGLDWQATKGLMKLIETSDVKFIYTFHDYSAVCHRNNLLLPSNKYCGMPEIDVCRICVQADRDYPEATDPEELRQVYARFLQKSAKVYAPSHDIADRILAGGADYAIEIVPHEAMIDIPTPVIYDNKSDKIVLAVLGAVGPHKGSRILSVLARDTLARKLPLRYQIIGYSDIPDELKDAGVTESGRYENDQEVLIHLRLSQPNFIFLPSIWPESYSYTLSLAFISGIIPIVFDIGAPAARIRDTKFGVILACELMSDCQALNDRIMAVFAHLVQQKAQALPLYLDCRLETI